MTVYEVLTVFTHCLYIIISKGKSLTLELESVVNYREHMITLGINFTNLHPQSSLLCKRNFFFFASSAM